MTPLEAMMAEKTALAPAWPLTFMVRETQPGHIGVAIPSVGIRQAHLTCGLCGQSVICLSPDLSRDGGYQVTVGQISASSAAHICQRHAR